MTSLLQFTRFSLQTHALGQVQGWTKERLQHVQQRRLRKLLKHAVHLSPFYRRKYVGIDIRSASLEMIPPTTKEELRRNLDDVFTDQSLRQTELLQFVSDEKNLGRWLRGRYAVSHTSGSQGAPLLVVQDRRNIELIFAMMSARAGADSKPGPVEAFRRLLDPQRVAIATFRRSFYPSGAALEFMQEIVGPYARVLRLSSLAPDLIDQLNKFQPHILVAYASVLDALAVQRERLQLRQLKKISNSSEQLTTAARARIEQAFGVPVHDHYGIGECLQLADGCSQGQGIHVNSDWSILESVDDEYRPVPFEASGSKVLITNLANFVQPFIRYEVNDRIVLTARQCACDSPLPSIARLEGRSAETFWIDDGENARAVTGVLFHSAVDSFGLFREWQATQLASKHIELLLEPLPGVSLSDLEAASRIRRRLLEYDLPAEVRVDVRLVDSIRADVKTGKVHRMQAIA